MDIFKFYFNNRWSLVVEIGPLLIVLILTSFLLYRYIVSKNTRFCEYEIDEAEIGVGNSKIKIKPRYEDMQIAYQLYVELSTRKIGLPIDFTDDFILEIYNSWYEFFKITREHIKEIPAQKVRRSETTKTILRIAIEILNDGLRPHLTKWQARFRKWFEIHAEKEDFKSKSPQDLQIEFPEYAQLVEDMRVVNQKLMHYRKILKEISIGLDN